MTTPPINPWHFLAVLTLAVAALLVSAATLATYGGLQ
jgi:hypothetical protein